MKLNLRFYKGKDEYSDGELYENKVLELIDKYSDDYEKAFKEDSSWPIVYHLSSIRKNVIMWYPFKENSSILEFGGGMGALTEELCLKCKSVTSIELSKKRATAILNRNKDKKNLEIIVGNFKDIILKKKYDYILLNGVLEYAALYIDSDSPYAAFINKLKENLKPDGKILIAIENKFGLKYWCGANEDHTNIQFDGINNYPNYRGIRTFSKNELEKLAEKCNMKVNFYYMFPDYKFPQVVFTDKSLDKKVYANYLPYYSIKPNLVFNELNLFNEIYQNSVIPFFANSYFLEFCLKEEPIEVDFVKFNDYRNNDFNIYTVCMNNKYYKYSKFNSSESFFNKYLNGNKELLDLGFDVAIIKKDKNGYYTDEIKGKSFLDNIIDDYSKNGEESLLLNLKKYNDYCKKKFNYISTNFESDIFDKYGIKVLKRKKKKFHYIDKLFIDIIPLNMLYDGNSYKIIDQEWYFKNAPYEFLLYRAISNTLFNCTKNYDRQLLLNYLKRFKIDDYIDEFEKLETSFQTMIREKNINSLSKFVLLEKDSMTIRIDDFNTLICEKENLLNNNNELFFLNIILMSEKSDLLIEKNELKNMNNELSSKNGALINENNLLLSKNDILKSENDEYKNQNIFLNEKLLNTEQYLNNVLNSKSWKITGIFRNSKKAIKRIIKKNK